MTWLHVEPVSAMLARLRPRTGQSPHLLWGRTRYGSSNHRISAGQTQFCTKVAAGSEKKEEEKVIKMHGLSK